MVSAFADSAKENSCEKVGKINHKYSVGDVVQIHRLVKIGPGTWDNEYINFASLLTCNFHGIIILPH